MLWAGALGWHGWMRVSFTADLRVGGVDKLVTVSSPYRTDCCS